MFGCCLSEFELGSSAARSCNADVIRLLNGLCVIDAWYVGGTGRYCGVGELR